MHHLREMIRRVSRSQAPVDIYGESGTGKELVARLIHETGPRRDGPFVPGELRRDPDGADGERALRTQARQLHRRGSDKKGLIQAAEGGTLFLDEIADLPLHMQVKLLRVIQEKSVRPIGEQAEVQHRRSRPVGHPQESRRPGCRGQFREDLFYRINVIEMRVPALRERPEDIPELAEAVLRRLGRRMKIDRPPCERGARGARDYAFPGNVRELENILERAITLSTAARSSGGHPAAAPASRLRAQRRSRQAASPLGDHSRTRTRGDRKALEQTRYNKTAAAKMLGMSFARCAIASRNWASNSLQVYARADSRRNSLENRRSSSRWHALPRRGT